LTNFERRLKPKVMLILDAVKNELDKPLLLDMAEDDRRKQDLIDKGKRTECDIERIEIARDLEPGSFDIDVARVRDDYLFRGTGEYKGSKRGLFSFLKMGLDWD